MIRVVHVGETTLDKRVSEFNTTDEASLTAAEFRDHIRKEEEEEALRLQALDHLAALPAPEGSANHGCSHVSKARTSAHEAHAVSRQTVVSPLHKAAFTEAQGTVTYLMLLRTSQL